MSVIIFIVVSPPIVAILFTDGKSSYFIQLLSTNSWNNNIDEWKYQYWYWWKEKAILLLINENGNIDIDEWEWQYWYWWIKMTILILMNENGSIDMNENNNIDINV